jgi:hypothetical protein
VHDFQQTRQPFRSYTAGEMRARLLLEFGDQYEVTGTSHYLVVHPRRQRDLWASRFESLFRSFELYFGSRGLVSTSPKFPLVAIVFSNRPAFAAHARLTGAKLPDSAIGYYSPRSNRILMYDQSASQRDQDWHHHAKTIIHEAAHQMATTPAYISDRHHHLAGAAKVWRACSKLKECGIVVITEIVRHESTVRSLIYSSDR